MENIFIASFDVGGIILFIPIGVIAITHLICAVYLNLGKYKQIFSTELSENREPRVIL